MLTLQLPQHIQPSGDWARDNASGRDLAGALIDAARSNANPCIINAALRGIAEGGRWSGVEVGFAFALAAAAMTAGAQ